MKALVIPSNREGCFRRFMTAWQETGAGDWQEVVLVEDSDQRQFAIDPSWPWPVHSFSHAEIGQRLGKDAWIISRGDSARRCFGFLVAAQDLRADYILTLDDDCYPVAGVPPICAAHLAAMRSHSVCQPTAGMRTRGLPYRNLGQIESKLNMGLWRGNADIDGPTGLMPQPYFVPPPGSTLANPQCRYPICGMNLFFSADLLPTMYFPLMGDGQPYRRFDDIWWGWIFQRLAQHCRIAWSFGEPWIEHMRASDPFRNLVAEAPGIVENETFWERVNAVNLTETTLAGAVAELAAGFQGDARCYFRDLGRAIAVWLRLTDRAALVDAA